MGDRLLVTMFSTWFHMWIIGGLFLLGYFQTDKIYLLIISQIWIVGSIITQALKETK